MRVYKLKLTFHYFLLCLCLYVCVRSISDHFWLRETISPVAFFEKVWVSQFFLLMQCKSGSLYFLHKLLNETAYLRSMKSPGVGITAFFVCPTAGNRPTSDRYMVERNHS